MRNITIRTESVRRFLAEANKIAQLSADEELSLIALAKEGDASARARILESNALSAFKMAKEYANGDDALELTSAAVLGMADAIASFDATKGVRFYTYAQYYMRLGIHTYLRTDAQLVINKGLNRLGGKPKRAADKFYAENGRMPSDEELAEILSKDGVEVESNSQLVAHKTIFLDDVIDEEGTTLAEVGEVATATAIRNEVEDAMDAEQNAHDAEKLLSVLPVRERTILEMAFGIGYDMEYDDAAIADKIGISDERVRQLKIKALKTLKERGRAILSA